MSAFATEPMSFTAARDFLARKVDLPTTLGALDLSLKLPERIRAQSFFSARVASANVLQALRKETEAIMRGAYNYAEGRGRLKEFLAAQGYGVPAVGSQGEHDLKELASTRRLDLILRQNVAMAHAVSQREVAEHPAVMELLPNYEYSVGPNPRAEHAAFDGLILPKTDPFWATHYPPWDYNCNCMVLDTDAEPNGKTAGFKPKTPMDGHLDYGGMRQMAGNQSGFTFDSTPKSVFAKPDFSRIEDPDLRSQVESAFKTKFPAIGLAAAQASAPSPSVIPPAPAWKLPAAFSHFEKATPPEVAALSDPPNIVATNSTTKAYFSPTTDTVHINKNPNTWGGSLATYHHEVAHYLHKKLGVVTALAIDQKFKEAIHADTGTIAGMKFGSFKFSDFKNKAKQVAMAMAAAKHLGVEAAFSAGDVLARQRVLFLFDTIGGMTVGTYGWGHKKSYYQIPRNGAKEVFANCTTAAILGWPEYKLYFPNTMQYIAQKLGLT